MIPLTYKTEINHKNKGKFCLNIHVIVSTNGGSYEFFSDSQFNNFNILVKIVSLILSPSILLSLMQLITKVRQCTFIIKKAIIIYHTQC